MIIGLEEIWNADKVLSIEPDWKPRPRDSYVRLVSPLDVEGITVEGLRFTASALLRTPQRSVTFQIEYLPPKRQPRGGPLARVEWKPLRPHNNKGIGPTEYRHTAIVGSHIHPFDLNWNHSAAQLRKGSLPIAVPISESVDTYEEILDFVEKKFKIKGVSELPHPPWADIIV